MKKLYALLMALMLTATLCPAYGELVATEDVTVYTRPDHWMTDLTTLFENVHFDLYYAGENSAASQKLHLIIPEGEGPHPLIIYVHGGGWGGLNSSGTSVAYTSEASLYAVGRGYAVACVDYRLLGEGVNIFYMAQDVKAAVRFLRANAAAYNLDPNKFALLGESAGGQLVDIVGTTNGESAYDNTDFGNAEVSSDVQAVVSWYSVAQLDEGLVAWLYNVDTSALTPEELQAKIDESSAMAHIDENDPPFLLQVGLIDVEVPYTQTIDFYNDLAMAGVDVTLDLFPGYGHAVTGFTCDENGERIVQWLNGVFGIE